MLASGNASPPPANVLKAAPVKQGRLEGDVRRFLDAHAEQLEVRRVSQAGGMLEAACCAGVSWGSGHID